MKDFLKKIFNREEKEVPPEVKRRKTILFFGFYLVFFIFLFFYMRDMNVVKEGENNEETVITYKTEFIENSNYTYVYEIEENENIYSFRGKSDTEN